MHEFEINTPVRQAAFLAQVGHESGGLHWMVELWDPTPAQRRYETRYDLGNTAPGDGYKYRGRGLIQLTGRGNYKRAGDALGVDLVEHPELLGEPGLACRSAGWFWRSHGCNELADAGKFEAITKVINGGLNGYPERLGLWERAKEVLA
jgi:putative chitinase